MVSPNIYVNEFRPPKFRTMKIPPLAKQRGRPTISTPRHLMGSHSANRVGDGMEALW